MNTKTRILECVPNISEGRNPAIIQKIARVVEKVEGVRLLDIDPGVATHRTVITFVGPPEAVIEAAFHLIKEAAASIDMRQHQGEHPRMGATDVCPLVPVSGITLEEAAEYAHQLGKRVGEELGIPVYMYEAAATSPDRTNLAVIRSGEYEGLEKKLLDPAWKPDYGPTRFNPGAGATVIGARDFLIAYNVNLNTTSVRRANAVAFDIREQGRVQREGNTLTGKIKRDENGEPLRIPGELIGVKAIGWFIEEYGVAQVSMNITNVKATPFHIAFEACRNSANRRGMRVTGSELVGLIPKKALIDAGKYFLHQQHRSTGIPEREIIHIAVKSMGLDELTPFDPDKKIIEYLLEDKVKTPLVNLSLQGFAYKTASESVAPGGGSVSAYAGALGAALATMVANLSAHKRGWDDRWQYFSEQAEIGQSLVDKLLFLVDEDTHAFNKIIDAVRMPKSTVEEKKLRKSAMEDATKYAIHVPLEVMRTVFRSLPLVENMIENGNPSSVSDAGVGILCLRAAAWGAWLNVKINMSGISDETFKQDILEEGQTLIDTIDRQEQELRLKLEKLL